MKGYFDGNGSQIHEPGFDPDTLFYYEVNMVFLWNEYSRKYEIQGQGPFDIYWGEYSVFGANELDLSNLKTTDLNSNNKELELYDSLFFHTLMNVTDYSISFSIKLPPLRGEFVFNNDGPLIKPDRGVLGTCHGRHKDDYDIDTRSTAGVVAVTQLNPSFIEGYFYFDASGIGDDAGVNYSITNGKFLLQLSAADNWLKPHGFEN